jgi:hypothetical protein
MLNAVIDDDVQVNEIMGAVLTEEDVARWGAKAAHEGLVELNTLITVTERGRGLGSAISKWRVASVTAYQDENGIPYYEMQLEGLGQVLLEARWDGEPTIFVSAERYKEIQDQNAADDEADGYTSSSSAIALPSGEDSNEEGGPRDDNYYVTGDLSGIMIHKAMYSNTYAGIGSGVYVYAPLQPEERAISKGEGCWAIAEEILAMNGIIARVDRVGRLICKDISRY